MSQMDAKRLLLYSFILFLIRASVILLLGPGEAYHASDSGDHFVYHVTARQLNSDPDKWFARGGEVGYRAPGYFAFLTVVYSFVSPSFTIGQLSGAFVGTVNCVLLFILTKKISTVRVATIAFWLRGILPCFVIADTFVMSETLFAMFLLSALIVVALSTHNGSQFGCLAVGILVGSCMLIREAALFYPLIFIGCLWLLRRHQKDKLLCIACFCIGLVLILMPWMYRNYVVWEKALPLSYTAGVNLHIGNSERATGNFVPPPEEDKPEDIRWGTPEFERWHRMKALQYIGSHPAEFLVLGIKKVAWFLWPKFLREDLRVVYGGTPSILWTTSILSGISSSLLMLCSVAGFVLGRRDWYWRTTFAVILYALATTFIVVGHPRYRDPLDNLLIPYAAFAIHRWSEIRSGIQNQRWAAWSLALLLVAYIASWIWTGVRLTSP